MEKIVKSIVIDSNVELDVSQLDSKVVSDLLTYLYGDKKTIYQIAKYLHRHQMFATYYLECLLRGGLVTCLEEDMPSGIERFYTVSAQPTKLNMETRINKESEQIRVANEMGEQLRDVIVSLNKNDVNNISYIVSMLSDETAKDLVIDQQKLEKKMADAEKEVVDGEKNRQKYIMISMIAPYKFELDEPLDEPNE